MTKQYLNPVFILKICLHFLHKFGHNDQNSLFKMKFGIQANFEYAEFVGDDCFFWFEAKISFLDKFVPKTQNYLFQMKLGE